jgi:hypothetical protein
MLHQSRLLATAAVFAFVVIVMIAAVADLNDMFEFTGWLQHGNFPFVWGVLSVLLYIPLALLDSRSQS